MCPCALLVVANFDGIAGEWSRFKNWTILFLVYVGKNFRKDRLRHFPIKIFVPIRSKFLHRSICADVIELFAPMTLSPPTTNSEGMRASMHFPSLCLGRPHNPPMKLTQNKALSASLDSDP